MAYALNVRKGTIINNADIGTLIGGVARKINDRQIHIAKHLIDVVVFERVEGDEKQPQENKVRTGQTLYGIKTGDMSG